MLGGRWSSGRGAFSAALGLSLLVLALVAPFASGTGLPHSEKGAYDSIVLSDLVLGADSAQAAGRLTAINGTGSFSSLPADKRIVVSPGDIVQGQISLHAENNFSSSTVVPLVYTPSWGGHELSYRIIDPALAAGATTVPSVPIHITAPADAGTYYLVFAFTNDLNGAQVASCTSREYGDVAWNDGNDLADVSAEQAAEAQALGVTSLLQLNNTGYRSQYVAAEVITIEVRAPWPVSLDSILLLISSSSLIAVSAAGLVVWRDSRRRPLAEERLNALRRSVEGLPPFAREEYVARLSVPEDMFRRKRYRRTILSAEPLQGEVDRLRGTLDQVGSELEASRTRLQQARSRGLDIDEDAIGLTEVRRELGGG